MVKWTGVLILEVFWNCFWSVDFGKHDYSGISGMCTKATSDTHLFKGILNLKEFLCISLILKPINKSPKCKKKIVAKCFD